MKLVLTDDVKGLGHRGDVVTVAEGYGRNFLVPKALAYPATAGNVKRLEQERKRYDARIEHEKDQASAVAKSIEGAKIVLHTKAGENDSLYGSVTPSEVAVALEAKGITVDKRKIDLEEPIKRLGTHTVHVKLHRDVTVELTVEVLPVVA
ncbi:MAG: 50S ribosomal protein L9 [Thermoanaerobaculia bacterium]